mmetsp:Transcript_11322/g.15797  ORF Transcript_11322/g.15797 Transcript_11322/m.15797 type:complete len:452 (+) Transcript_11322:197-1552(+)
MALSPNSSLLSPSPFPSSSSPSSPSRPTYHFFYGMATGAVVATIGYSWFLPARKQWWKWLFTQDRTWDCKICGVKTYSANQYAQHMKGKKHLRVLRDRERIEELRKRELRNYGGGGDAPAGTRLSPSAPASSSSSSSSASTSPVRSEVKDGLERGSGDMDDGAAIDSDGVPRRLRKCETVLQRRTDRMLLVIEKSYDPHNQHAVLRTAEAFGVQNVWFVDPPMMNQRKLKFFSEVTAGFKSGVTGLGSDSVPGSSGFGSDIPNGLRYDRIARSAPMWLSLRHFKTTKGVLEALRSEGREIWVTDLSQKAVPLEKESNLKIPNLFALVIGRESDGVSDEMLAAADRRVYLPMHGFAESLNLSVATALVIQKLFMLCPEMVGDMSEAARQELRARWYAQLARKSSQEELYRRFLDRPPKVYKDLRRAETLRNTWVRKKIRVRQGDTKKSSMCK